MTTRRHSRYWRPDQHGAWPMIIAPVIVGIAWLVTLRSLIDGAFLADGIHGGLGTALTAVTVSVAWIVGYLTFFAGGKWIQARRSGNARILDAARLPTLVYGAITVVAALLAIILQPHLLWWAIVFGPLTLIAVSETNRGTPRSFIAGASETIASAFLIAVLASVGVGSASPVVNGISLTRNVFSSDVVSALPREMWVTVIWLALYQVGTILYVKTMIRKKGSRPWWIGSIVYHGIALVAVLVTLSADNLALIPWLLTTGAMGWALWRSYAVPKAAQSQQSLGHAWTPKRVGMAEIPLVVVITVAGLLAGILYDGPLVLFVG